MVAAAEEEDFHPEVAAGEEDVEVSLPEVVAEVEVDVEEVVVVAGGEDVEVEGEWAEERRLSLNHTDMKECLLLVARRTLW